MQRSVERQMRVLLALLLAVAIVGVALELMLLGHYEEWQQWLPLAALPAGLASVVGVYFARSAFVLVVHLLVMTGFVLIGVLGIFLHYRGNVEFELEMVPALGGVDLLREAITGATPVLAPGTMILLGMVGLVLGYRHPLLGRGSAGASDDSEALFTEDGNDSTREKDAR